MSARGGPRRIAVFCAELLGYGGAERLVFEEAEHLSRAGFDTRILAIRYAPSASFEGFYRLPVDVLRLPRRVGGGGIARYVAAVVALTAWFLRHRPDLVIAMSTNECALLLVPALLTRTRYLAHINGTIFWFPNTQNLTKYALLHRHALREVAKAWPTMSEFVPLRPPPMPFARRVRLELSAILHWLAVRGAIERITFSERMAGEVRLIYGRSAICLKGAFPHRILSYRPRSRPLDRFRRDEGPVIFNANRLEPRKRVGLTIRAFAEALRTSKDATLVIAGEGGERAALEGIARELGVSTKVHFVGFVPEEELWDWLASADVFIHLNWADFAIAPFEALALARKVVWANEMEMDEAVARTGLVFVADPTAEAAAAMLVKALAAPERAVDLAPLDAYTWENYFSRLIVRLNACWAD